MITKILVTLDMIDNGYLDPRKIPSTCAVAQALGKPLFAQHFPSAQVFNNFVLLRGPNDIQDTVFTVSIAFRDWIFIFDRWQKLRSKLQTARLEGKSPRALRGRPPRPITILVDSDKYHISIDGEPQSESGKAELPAHLEAQYSDWLYGSGKPLRKAVPRRGYRKWPTAGSAAKRIRKGEHLVGDPKTEKPYSFE